MKCLRDGANESKRGISQSDVYQMMAYAQLYDCNRLLMLYPHHAGLSKAGLQHNYGIAAPGKQQSDRLQIATIDIGQNCAGVVAALQQIVLDAVERRETCAPTFALQECLGAPSVEIGVSIPSWV